MRRHLSASAMRRANDAVMSCARDDARGSDASLRYVHALFMSALTPLFYAAALPTLPMLFAPAATPLFTIFRIHYAAAAASDRRRFCAAEMPLIIRR